MSNKSISRSSSQLLYVDQVTSWQQCPLGRLLLCLWLCPGGYLANTEEASSRQNKSDLNNKV